MNQEVRKIIKSSFCPKDKWVPDKDVHNCFKCDEKFHTLFRRKHHCRYCGQIFCNKCSDFFFQGKDLGESEKQVRMCNACYQKCWKYLVKHDESYIQFRKSNDGSEEKIPDAVQSLKQIKSSSFTQEDKLIQIRQIINEYNTSDLAGLKALEADADKKFTILLQVMLKQKKIPLKYLPNILQVAKGVVDRSPPNALITNNMDICRNIKFKCFMSQQFQIKLSNKILVKKYFQSKKLKDSYENVNCILVYGGLQSANLVGGTKQASFEEIVNNRTKEMGKLISYCERLGINIIFLQGSIQKQCDDKFMAAGITVIPKIKIDHIGKLKAALQIQKIVDSVHQLYNYTKQQIVGKIQSMTSEFYTSIKDTSKIKKFYAVKSYRDQLGMTVFILGKHRQVLQNIKTQFNWIIMCLRHLRLKVHKVLLDQALLNSMNEQTRNDCYLHNPQMFFSFYNQHHSDILNYIKEKYLSYKHIRYFGSNFENYPQVTKMNLDQYLLKRTHSFRNRWDYFTQICGQINDEHRLFYSTDDAPIGVYILKKLTTRDKDCSVCKRSNNTHIDVFYSTDHFVKIWTESRTHYQKQDNIQQMLVQQQNQIEMMFSGLSKQAEKSKMQCYIQCQKCQEELSARIKLKKQHLQYSMISFLNHFFKGTTQTVVRQNNSKQKVMNKQATCNHHEKVRVFSMSGKSVKIFVGSYTLNRLLVLTETGRASYLAKKQLMHCNQYCVIQNVKIQHIINYLLDEIRSIAEGSKNPKLQKMFQDPKSSFINARKSILACSNVKLSQAQCLDMILPQFIEQLTKINTVSILLLNPKKVHKFFECLQIYHTIVNLLKKSYIILNELKKSIKKRELEMKYQVSDFVGDFLMEQIDISSLADSSSVGDVYETQSQVTKGQNMSTQHDMQKIDNIENYEWLQPYEGTPQLNRSDRKTVFNRRTNKASQQEVTRTFKQLSSFLWVEHAYLSYVPSFPHMSQTLIASSLNSQYHKQCLSQTSKFLKQLTIRMNKFLEGGQLKVNQEELHKLQTVIQVHERMFDISNRVKKNQNTSNYQVTLLYPNQFETLRRKNRILLPEFIQSVGGAQSWLATGGKSGSSFMRSFNDLLVIKKVTVKQFTAFRKFLPEYFTHLHSGSLLVPIYGAYIVTKNSASDYFIVMENLFFGMKNWYIYDFKGSVTRRFSKWPVVPLDVNFLIDRNSEPIFCKENPLKNLLPTLDYLTKNNIVDYSLIIVVQIESQKDYYMDGNRFHMGIVDYLRQFGAMERVQRTWKGQQATVQQPADYKNRLYKNIKKYFTQIPL